jgi:hypothetical protein
MKRSAPAGSGFVTSLLTACIVRLLVLFVLVPGVAGEPRGGAGKGDGRVIHLPKPAVKGTVFYLIPVGEPGQRP